MSTDRSDPSLAYTLPFQVTNTIHRQVQDELQPETEENRATAMGKIVVVTGGGTGIGAVSPVLTSLSHDHISDFPPGNRTSLGPRRR